MTTVEIPPGSGNRYRYEYENGKTVYKGPVGNAPELGEVEFLEMMAGVGIEDPVVGCPIHGDTDIKKGRARSIKEAKKTYTVIPGKKCGICGGPIVELRSARPGVVVELGKGVTDPNIRDLPLNEDSTGDEAYVIGRDRDTVYVSRRRRKSDGLMEETIYRISDPTGKLKYEYGVGEHVPFDYRNRYQFYWQNPWSGQHIYYPFKDEFGSRRYWITSKTTKEEKEVRNQWLTTQMRTEGYNVIQIWPDRGRITKVEIKELKNVLRTGKMHGFESDEFDKDYNRMWDVLGTDKGNRIDNMYRHVSDLEGEDTSNVVFRIHSSQKEEAGEFMDAPYGYFEKRYQDGISKPARHLVF